MARPRTPTNVLELRGSFIKDPQRKRLNEPKPNGEIGKHSTGSTELEKIWDELVASCAPNVLTNADRISLEIAVHYLRQFRLDPANFSNERARILIGLLSKFGMTPSDRAKLSIPESNSKNIEDPWARLAREH